MGTKWLETKKRYSRSSTYCAIICSKPTMVHGDETTIQVLKEPGKPAKAKSYLWAQATGSGPPIRLFTNSPGRGGNHASPLYAGIRRGSTLMSDGNGVYGSIAQINGLTHLGCWANCRRYFVEAEAVIPKAARTSGQPATQFIAAIGELYAVESKAKGKSVAARSRPAKPHRKRLCKDRRLD